MGQKFGKAFWAVVGLVALSAIFDDDSDPPSKHSAITPSQTPTTHTQPKEQPTTKQVRLETPKVLPSTKPNLPSKPTPQKFNKRTMYVDASRLNVRRGPAKDYQVIWTLKRDEQVTVVGKQNDWLEVRGARYSGWVFGSYLTPKPKPKKTIAAVPKTPQLSTSAIKDILIKRSHAYYPGNCPCPYNITAAGRRCGGRSAYSRPGGRSPLCYPSDVSATMVADYRARQ